MAQQTNRKADRSGQPQHGGLKMMALMMSCCIAVIVVFALIPVVGWPIGLALGAVAVVGMGFAHQRLMGHGSHH